MLKNSPFYPGILAFILFALLCIQGFRCAYAYNELGPNSDLIVLIPGQSRAIMPNLWALVPDSYHTALVITAGEGALTASVRNASFLENGADFIFGRLGFVNTTPVIGSTYSAGKLTSTITVPVAGFGIIITGILSDWGDIDYPLQLHMLFSLEPVQPGSSDNETVTQ
mgnify:CR=1 FL=1